MLRWLASWNSRLFWPAEVDRRHRRLGLGDQTRGKVLPLACRWRAYASGGRGRNAAGRKDDEAAAVDQEFLGFGAGPEIGLERLVGFGEIDRQEEFLASSARSSTALVRTRKSARTRQTI